MMRKITSLLLTAILLATTLTVFAVPASAAENFTVIEGKKDIIKSDEEYNTLRVYGLLVVDTEGELTVNDLIIESYGSLMLKPGAKIKAKKITVNSAVLSVPSGATIEVEDKFIKGDCTTLEPGATLKAKTLSGGETLTVCSGATLIASEIESCGIDLYGTLKSPEGTFFKAQSVNVSYHNGALLDVTCENNEMTKQIMMVPELPEEIEGNRVYKHTHTFNNACANCGEEQGSDLTASTLSEGSIAIITAVAGLAVGFLVAMFIFKKKKPALASGENTDE